MFIVLSENLFSLCLTIIYWRREEVFPLDLLAQLREVVWPGDQHRLILAPVEKDKKDTQDKEQVPLSQPKDQSVGGIPEGNLLIGLQLEVDIVEPITKVAADNPRGVLCPSKVRGEAASEEGHISPEAKYYSIFQRTGVKRQRALRSKPDHLDLVESLEDANLPEGNISSPGVYERWRDAHPASKLQFLGDKKGPEQSSKASPPRKTARRQLPGWMIVKDKGNPDLTSITAHKFVEFLFF